MKSFFESDPTQRESLTSTQLEAYFERIELPTIAADHFAGASILNYDVLRRVVYNHVLTFPFDNIDMHNIISDPACPIPIDLQSIYSKFIENTTLGQRGGYCFETTTLLKTVLSALHFDVRMFITRVSWLQESKIPPSHLTMVVKLENKEYMVDIGFGGPGPIEPLLFTENGKLYEATQLFPQHSVTGFRFTRTDEGDFQLESNVQCSWRSESKWKPLFSFSTSETATDELIQSVNQHVSVSGESPFLKVLFVTQPFRLSENKTGTKTLTSKEYTEITDIGRISIIVNSQDEFFQLLNEKFKFSLPSGSDLHAKQLIFADELKLQLQQIKSEVDLISNEGHTATLIMQHGKAEANTTSTSADNIGKSDRVYLRN